MSLRPLGRNPTVDSIDRWFLESNFERSVIGTSVQGRDLVCYVMERNSTRGTDDDPVVASNPSTVLFFSLSHGNEPMGLHSLLSTAQKILSSKSYASGYKGLPPARLVFIPIVNVDGYSLNLQRHITGETYHRANLRGGENCTHPEIGGGVDLNRNYPSKLDGSVGNAFITAAESSAIPCSPHTFPFSEPETQAVRTVVNAYNVTHAMSFHSMAHSRRPRLLIHPYTSERAFEQMAPQRSVKYRKWSNAMNDIGKYRTGTAKETIGYTAQGTSIDWMEEAKSIFAFVVEAVPPCESRFCDDPKRVDREAGLNARTATRFFELASYDQIIDSGSSLESIRLAVACLGILFAWYFRYSLASRVRRLRRKLITPETERLPLAREV